MNKEHAFKTRTTSPMNKLQINVSRHSLLNKTDSKVTPVKNKTIPSGIIPKKKDVEEKCKEITRVSVDLNTSPLEEQQLEVFKQTIKEPLKISKTHSCKSLPFKRISQEEQLP